MRSGAGVTANGHHNCGPSNSHGSHKMSLLKQGIEFHRNYRNHNVVRFVAMVFLTILTGSAVAGWTVVGKNDEQMLRVYVDESTVRRNGNLVKMWSLRDYKEAQVLGEKTVLSAKNLDEYDCLNEQTRVLSAYIYSGNMGEGDVVLRVTEARNWQPVVPESVGAAKWKVACKKIKTPHTGRPSATAPTAVRAPAQTPVDEKPLNQCDEGMMVLDHLIDQRDKGVTASSARENMETIIAEAKAEGVKGGWLEETLLRKYVDYVYTYNVTKKMARRDFAKGCPLSR